MKIAVRCSSSLEQVIAELDRSGYYNREHCGPGDISMETGFQDFDPNTRVGRLRWSQLGRLLRMRFKQPVCKLAELRKVKDAWLQHMQSEKTVHRFLADDEVLYEPVVLAGGGTVSLCNWYTQYCRLCTAARASATGARSIVGCAPLLEPLQRVHAVL